MIFDYQTKYFLRLSCLSVDFFKENMQYTADTSDNQCFELSVDARTFTAPNSEILLLSNLYSPACHQILQETFGKTLH